MDPVERLNIHPRITASIDASRVDTVAIGVRSRNIKRFYTAAGTKQMASGLCIERVAGQSVLAAGERKIVGVHYQMQIPAFRTDTAIAINDSNVRRRPEFESDGPAMTTAMVDNFLIYGRCAHFSAWATIALTDA